MDPDEGRPATAAELQWMTTEWQRLYGGRTMRLDEFYDALRTLPMSPPGNGAGMIQQAQGG